MGLPIMHCKVKLLLLEHNTISEAKQALQYSGTSTGARKHFFGFMCEWEEAARCCILRNKEVAVQQILAIPPLN